MSKRKILSLAMALSIVAIMAVGATLAYFTDTDSKTNTFTVGNVTIEQYEKDRDGKDFVDDQKLFPIVDDDKNAEGYHTGKNYLDKIVTVKNTGTEAAYVRTHIAFPAALDNGANTFRADKNILHWNGASAEDTFTLANLNMDNDWYWDTDLTTDWPGNGGNWNFYQQEVDDVLYNVYVATHKSAVEADETTAPSLYGVYLDKGVDYKEGKYYNAAGEEFAFPTAIKVLVLTEAVQADGFEDKDAVYALNKAFGEVGTYNPWAK